VAEHTFDITNAVAVQLTATSGRPAAFEALRRAEGLAVCAALAGSWAEELYR
jgi:hypothetical protein